MVNVPLILEVPWITEVTDGRMCTGLKWSKISLKHIHSRQLRDGTIRPAEGIPDKARCKFKARFHFEAGTDKDYTDPFWAMTAHTGDYCIHHVISAGLYYSMAEEERTERWLREPRIVGIKISGK